MNIEIRKLIPDLAEEYVHFFDVTPHDDNIDEHKCYCVTWRSDDSYTSHGDHWFPTREETLCQIWQFTGLSCLWRQPDRGMVQHKRELSVVYQVFAFLLANRGIPCGY